MNCQRCGAREATCHWLEIPRTARGDSVWLCADCAGDGRRRTAAAAPAGPNPWSRSWRRGPGARPGPAPPAPTCGTTSARFRRDQPPGLPGCYAAFRDHAAAAAGALPPARVARGQGARRGREPPPAWREITRLASPWRRPSPPRTSSGRPTLRDRLRDLEAPAGSERRAMNGCCRRTRAGVARPGWPATAPRRTSCWSTRARLARNLAGHSRSRTRRRRTGNAWATISRGIWAGICAAAGAAAAGRGPPASPVEQLLPAGDCPGQPRPVARPGRRARGWTSDLGHVALHQRRGPPAPAAWRAGFAPASALAAALAMDDRAGPGVRAGLQRGFGVPDRQPGQRRHRPAL